MQSLDLAGYRVLIVEDEMAIAMVIEEGLVGLGCIVVGPVAKLSEAMCIASDEAFDAAILDVNIRGGQIFPVAEKLLARDIPFLFSSGYGDWAMPAEFRDLPRLTKPFTQRDLSTEVRKLLSRSRENLSV